MVWWLTELATLAEDLDSGPASVVSSQSSGTLLPGDLVSTFDLPKQQVYVGAYTHMWQTLKHLS